MARLLGIEIPNEKRIEIALTYVYGIGLSTSKKVLDKAEISPNLKAGELTDEQISRIIFVVNEFEHCGRKILIEGDLRREIQINLKRLQQVNCHRGLRHRRGLPVRGQRTKTNARTRKGAKRTIGVVR